MAHQFDRCHNWYAENRHHNAGSHLNETWHQKTIIQSIDVTETECSIIRYSTPWLFIRTNYIHNGTLDTPWIVAESHVWHYCSSAPSKRLIVHPFDTELFSAPLVHCQMPCKRTCRTVPRKTGTWHHRWHSIMWPKCIAIANIRISQARTNASSWRLCAMSRKRWPAQKPRIPQCKPSNWSAIFCALISQTHDICHNICWVPWNFHSKFVGKNATSEIECANHESKGILWWSAIEERGKLISEIRWAELNHTCTDPNVSDVAMNLSIVS